MTSLLAALVLSPSNLVLSLTPESWAFRPGDTFKSKLRYANSGRSPVTVLSLNASEYQSHKSPRGHLELRQVGRADWSKLATPPDCGNTNPIEMSDFQVLQPGESALRQAWFPWTEQVVGKDNMKPGQYDIRYVYDTSGAIDQWIGGPIPEPQHSERREQIRALFDSTPHGIFTSGPTRVTVR